jgi:TrmH family RNA methyltransferase
MGASFLENFSLAGENISFLSEKVKCIIRRMVSVVLARPESAENIGLVARAMANTGFRDLRIAGGRKPGPKAVRTAVHAESVLASARRFASVAEAVADLEAVFAATARPRKDFPCLAYDEAIARIRALPARTRIGLLFGNERTGLTSDEMKHSTYRFTIPQAARQPSYNLAAAVLLTLFPLFAAAAPPRPVSPEDVPLSRREQEECIVRILDVLRFRRFIPAGGERHVEHMVFELFGRLSMTAKDRRLLLAIFQKAAAAAPPSKGVS